MKWLLGGSTLLVLIVVSTALIIERLCPGHDSASSCDSGVFVVDDVSYADPSVRSVRACVDGRCELARRASGQSRIYVPVYRSDEAAVVVNVALRDRQGRVMTEDGRRVRLTADAPDGERCGPVCLVGQTKVDSGGNLRPVPRAAVR